MTTGEDQSKAVVWQLVELLVTVCCVDEGCCYLAVVSRGFAPQSIERFVACRRDGPATGIRRALHEFSSWTQQRRRMRSREPTLVEMCAPLRADALRNRARILEAAEAIFALEGVGVPIDAVANKAQVGVGTLYRHFPTKEALFEAIVLERLLALLATARDFEGEADPGTAIYAFLQGVRQESREVRLE